MVIGTLRNKLQWNINRNSYIFIQENALENVVCEMASILSRPQCVNTAMATVSFLSWLFIVVIDGDVWCRDKWTLFAERENHVLWLFDSVACGRCGSNFESIIFKLIVQNNVWGTPCEIALRGMPHSLRWEYNTGPGNGLVLNRC